jgi:hypothetical protein
MVLVLAVAAHAGEPAKAKSKAPRPATTAPLPTLPTQTQVDAALAVWDELCPAAVEKMKALPCAPPPSPGVCRATPEIAYAEPSSIRAMFACIDATMGCTPEGRTISVERCDLELVPAAGPPEPPPPPLPSGTNTTACRAYVEAFNAATCNPVDLRVADLCPDALDLTSCDLSSYYGCMAAGVRCSGDRIDLSAQVDCSMPFCR